MRLLLLLHRTHTQKKTKKTPQCNRTDAARFACLLKLELIHLQAFFFFFSSSTPFFPSEIVTARRSLQLAVRCVATPTTKCHRSVCRSVGCMCHRIWLVAARRLEKESSGAYRGGVHGISVCQRGGTSLSVCCLNCMFFKWTSVWRSQNEWV